MALYYIEMRCGCTLAKARDARRAEIWAARYFGEINGPTLVRKATPEDIHGVEMMGGKTHEL